MWVAIRNWAVRYRLPLNDHSPVPASGRPCVASPAEMDAHRSSARLMISSIALAPHQEARDRHVRTATLNRPVTVGSHPRWNQDDLPWFQVPHVGGDFVMVSGENASLLEGQWCAVCRGPIQVIRVETGVPGLPPGRQRKMVKCSACGLVATHTSISNKDDGQND